MKFDIPEHCHVRWQAALAVLEDLQEDKKSPFDMRRWADSGTIWEKTNGCGTAACFGGYISVAPYCLKLGFPKTNYGSDASNWLLDKHHFWGEDNPLHSYLFDSEIGSGSRKRTLAFLEKRIKKIFKESTGKNLVAPMTFYI